MVCKRTSPQRTPGNSKKCKVANGHTKYIENLGSPSNDREYYFAQYVKQLSDSKLNIDRNDRISNCIRVGGSAEEQKRGYFQNHLSLNLYGSIQFEEGFTKLEKRFGCV